MNAGKTLILIPALLLGLLVVGLPKAHADDWNELTYLTFNQPIRISSPRGPVDLIPGTYEFRLLGGVNRNIVQIYNSDGRLVTNIPTDSTEYLAPTAADLVNRTILTFAQGSRNQPLTLVKWFYPDNNFGHEFVYPKRVERQLSEERMITVDAVPAGHNLGSEIASTQYGH